MSGGMDQKISEGSLFIPDFLRAVGAVCHVNIVNTPHGEYNFLTEECLMGIHLFPLCFKYQIIKRKTIKKSFFCQRISQIIVGIVCNMRRISMQRPYITMDGFLIAIMHMPFLKIIDRLLTGELTCLITDYLVR